MLPRLLTIALMLLAGAGTAQAEGWARSAPAYAPPPVPLCSDVFARYGDRGIWVGQFAGRYPTQSVQGTSPYGAVGCFLSEAECRRWLHQNMTFAGSPMLVMSCRPAVGRTARY
jgi:hypothetical protein